MNTGNNYATLCMSLVCIVLAAAGCFHPQETYPNADRLVSASWVRNLIDTANGGRRYVLAEVGWGRAEVSYDSGHIPGAIHVNTDEIEYDLFEARSSLGSDQSPERSTTEAEDSAKGLTVDDSLPRNWWNLYPDEYLLPALAYMGIDTDTTVVVYGADVTAAARFVWALMYAGVDDVRLLDGGFEAWKSAGYETTTRATQRTPVADFGAQEALHPEYLVDIAYVRQVVTDESADDLIVDIRTHDEYTGKTAPYGYIPTSGRIAGAVWGHAGTGPWDMDDYLDSDGTLKPLSEIESMWADAGITGERHLSFYCGTAWRSSLAWLCAWMMGWEKIANFDSAWYEWSMGPEADLNPVEDDYPDLP